MKRSDNKLVYIVDDDPDDRQIILDAFLENKYQGDYAFIESGDQLLENLKDPDTLFPSLIMLDLNLPGIIGLHVLQEIRREKQYSHIPIIILTTSSLHMDRKLAYEYGTNCFLRKPNSFQYLVSLMDAIIRLWLIDNDL
ncbi:MAG TPA: response regulator [Puia sp.]|jgi:DNA-binding response OmpR family regulator|nr:response regulator [Puia sp.]